MRVAAVCAAAALGCAERAAPPRADAVAQVGATVITRREFDAALWRDLAQYADEPRSELDLSVIKRSVIEAIIDRTVFLREASTLGLEVTQDEVTARVSALASEYSVDAFNEAVAATSASREALTATVREQLLIEKLLAREVFARVAVSPAEIQAAVAADAGTPVSEQVHALHILVKTRPEAQRVQQLLVRGQEFSEVARKFSIAPDAKVGGDLGFFSTKEMPDAFDAALAPLSAKQMSGIIESAYGFHLFLLLERRAASSPEAHESAAEVEQRLLTAKRDSAQRAYTAELRKRADIHIDEAAVGLIAVANSRSLP